MAGQRQRKILKLRAYLHTVQTQDELETEGRSPTLAVIEAHEQARKRMRRELPKSERHKLRNNKQGRDLFRYYKAEAKKTSHGEGSSTATTMKKNTAKRIIGVVSRAG